MKKKSFNLFNKKLNKKAETGTSSALMQLFYIIMGTFILISFIKLINNFLDLNTITNEDIVASNANSIYNFHTYSSSNKYSNLDSCYNTLKITNLETYQTQEEEIVKNKMIVLTNDGVYSLPISQKETFLKNPNTNILKNIQNFDKKVILKLDETEQGWDFNVDLSVYQVGTFSNSLDIEKKIDYITFEPIFGKNFNFDEITNENVDFLNNRNQYLIKTIHIENDEPQISDSTTSEQLIFNPNTNEMFVSAGKVSDTMINNNLCTVNNFQIELEEKNYLENEGRNIPPSEYDVTFRIEFEGVDTGYEFTWSDEISCKKDNEYLNCNQILDIKEDQKITYIEFIDKIKLFQNVFSDQEGNYNLKVSYKRIPEQDILQRQKENPTYPKFTEVFKIKEIDIDKIINDDLDEPQLYEIQNINGCKKQNYCNKIYFNTGEMFPIFYLEGTQTNPIYGYLNTKYLSYKFDKENDKVYYYFHGIPVKIVHNRDANKLGSILGDVEIEILFNLKMYDKYGDLKDYTAMISKSQLKNIREIK